MFDPLSSSLEELILISILSGDAALWSKIGEEVHSGTVQK